MLNIVYVKETRAGFNYISIKHGLDGGMEHIKRGDSFSLIYERQKNIINS